MMAFLVLSSALTAVRMVNLAPEFDAKSKPDILDADPGIDPINIKNDYFKWVNARAGTTFENYFRSPGITASCRPTS